MSSPDQLAALIGADPVAASTAALQLAQQGTSPTGYGVPTDIDVEIYDNFWNYIGPGGDYISLKASLPRLKLPQAQLTYMGTDPMSTELLACDTTMVHVLITFSGGTLRWAGWVDVAHDKQSPDGEATVDCQLVGIATILDRILCWPQPFLPIEVQPSEALYVGPAITCIKSLVAENAFRLQLGLWDFWNNFGSLGAGSAFNWEAWIGQLLEAHSLSFPDLMEMVTTPVCVVFGDPLQDTSPWIAIHGRMDTCWKLMTQTLKDNGLYASLDLWLPGDPQPERLGYPLQVPTYIFNVRDYQGVTGPAAGILDGALIDIVDMQESLLSLTLAPYLNPKNEYVPPGSNIVIAPAFGINFVPPWVVFNADLDDSGLMSVDVAHHCALAWQLVMGGRSPQWLNDAMNATLEWLVDLLLMTIGITGIPNSILDGLLDNSLLAFEIFDNIQLRINYGPYAPPEKFFPTQSTYDIDIVFDAIKAAWDTRGYPAAMFTFINGQGYQLGVDVWPGAMASVIKRGTLYSDYLDDIVVIDDADHRGRIEVVVGDGRREEAPMAIIQRKLVEAEEDLMLALLAPPNA